MNINQIINRLKDAKKIQQDTQLADLLGIKKTTLSSWRTRNSMDFELVFAKCEPEINLDWLITGRGDMFYSQNQEKPTPSSSTNMEALQVAADERERTIQVLQDTNTNLLKEVEQLRNYVHVTSSKYIQIVEQTLATAQQTQGTVQQLQAQIGFHTQHHHNNIAAHHDDKTH